jgi:hypothetical protein
MLAEAAGARFTHGVCCMRLPVDAATMAHFRVYAELNDFLAPAQRGQTFEHREPPHASLKHAIEALGVPHTEVGLVLRNGAPCPLDHRPLQEDDRISVFPAWRRLALQQAAAAPPRFIADAHLARLARYLRFAGYDTLLHDRGDDAELAARARDEWRIVLTRDRQLLMHRGIEQGCYLRPTDPLAQLRELVHRLRLDLEPGRRATRCLLCNEALQEINKSDVQAGLLPRTRESFSLFWHCTACQRVYWHGSHWRRMRERLDAISDDAQRMPA